jgi:hypothetical protein
MSEFNTNIKLGELGYIIRSDGNYNFYVKPMIVGQVRVERTHPKYRSNIGNKPLFQEEYMCEGTGIGGGILYTYGYDIFSTEADAINIGIVKHKQRAYKQIAMRDEQAAKWAAETKARELRQLEELKAKYEAKE